MSTEQDENTAPKEGGTGYISGISISPAGRSDHDLGPPAFVLGGDRVAPHPDMAVQDGDTFRFGAGLGAALGGFTEKKPPAITPDDPLYRPGYTPTDDEINNSPFDITGTAGAAKVWADTGKMEKLLLPVDYSEGKIAFYPPDNWTPTNPLRKDEMNGREGFIDYYGNVWVKCTFNKGVDAHFEWDVQLSARGKEMWGHLSRSGSHINVLQDGTISHGAPKR